MKHPWYEAGQASMVKRTDQYIATAVATAALTQFYSSRRVTPIQLLKSGNIGPSRYDLTYDVYTQPTPPRGGNGPATYLAITGAVNNHSE